MKADHLSRRKLPPVPVAPVRPAEITLYGQTVRDDYAWLKAGNWRDVLKDPEALAEDIRAHLDRENAYADGALEDAENLRERFIAEMRGRIKEDDATVPEADGPFAYYTRYREGGEHPLVCREPRDGGPEEVLLDGDREGEDFPFFDLGDAETSPDHKLLAWSADRKGS